MEPINDILLGIAKHINEGEYGALLQDFAGIYVNTDEGGRERLKQTWQELIEEYLLRNHGVVQEAEG